MGGGGCGGVYVGKDGQQTTTRLDLTGLDQTELDNATVGKGR